MAVGPDGDLYFADLASFRIRKLTRDGKVVTVAGNGSTGFEGDNGPAIEARLGGPLGIVFDGAGNLLIADGVNGRIRKVTFGK
jgi:sugar lactone lactonase YvrE